ncbi:MAG: DnaD domain protein [Lachnospiraceae bacterium]|nr:DnaD domain protein [Lachnospiraceae bacterium]
MSSLTIYKDSYVESTVISNRFIDEFLAEANDAQIKVYLYLVRMMSANLPTGVSDMADKFNYTEKDIMRALKYWEKKHLLTLEFNEAKALTGIRFLSSIAPSKEEPKPLAPIVPLKLVSSDGVEDAPSAKKEEKVEKETEKPSYENISYSRDDLKKFKENPETEQLPFIAEQYLKKPLSLTDIEILYFIHYELKFSADLIDYLLQYCVERSQKFSYIKKVAIAWAEANVTTPKQAKAYLKSNIDKPVYTILKSLGRSNTPTPTEAEIANKWYKDYGFTLDIIDEACRRTVLAVDSHRLEYCDRILSSWKKSGVKNLSDISALDASYKKPKASTPSTKNTFNQMIHTDYDFDEIERSILSN